MQTQTLPLKNMHCASCQQLVTMTLTDVAGVQKVEANQLGVAVTYDETATSVEVLRQALEGIGHAGD